MAAGKIMSDEEGLPCTLTPKENISQDTNILRVLPWGRLIPCKAFLQPVDLVESFSFGRGEECSTSVTTRNCPPKLLLNISKKHFQIDKCVEDNLIYITDFSKNGTFVNQEKLGLGRRKILKHNDRISVSLPLYSIYIFWSQGTEGIDDFLPLELIGRFVHIRRLGGGSCGEVRLVKDRNTFKQYAIKKILLSESNSSQVHKINHPNKINNEITILRTLSHPCIVGMKDLIEIEKEVYLVLEYMAGGELTKRITKRPMTEDTAKFYFYQMLLATHYLHSCGVIHRDLKPENILLLDDREETLLKITDFGLSKITEQCAATTMCGTLRYVAPEVINNGFRDYGEYGKEVDIWSLGVILYFMISRDFPFKGEENSTMVNNILSGKYDLSHNVWSNPDKAVLKDLMKKILQLQPKNRITILKMFEHAWIKHDHGVKLRVKKLLEREGLDNPMEELSLEPSPKKFKFSVNVYSSSSDESNTTLANVSGSSFQSSPSICC